ncbi:DDE-type integrase/transposase/recombinase [Acidisoma cellulosilytica]|uniref:DDE-type integrase/transposase/recombinase n=1 Tax=Acidisoma cellulosilyticum TaxID=2802395 RepID=A0A964E5K2_9PROT|nr:DDE-type integrase/transposase/recombinase [Acidisoma cellulosilyticum]
MKIRGDWVYLYRAVDRCGQTLNFRLSRRRNAIRERWSNDQVEG